MKYPALLATMAILLTMFGCAGGNATPTPDSQATVAAAGPTAVLTPTPDVEATVEARQQTTIAALPTATLLPTPTPTRLARRPWLWRPTFTSLL